MVDFGDVDRASVKLGWDWSKVYTYACVYVCIGPRYTRIYVRMNIHIRIFVRMINTYDWSKVYTYVCTYVSYIHTRTLCNTCMYKRIDVCVCVCIIL
jgi:hypothetical protein